MKLFSYLWYLHQIAFSWFHYNRIGDREKPCVEMFKEIKKKMNGMSAFLKVCTG